MTPDRIVDAHTHFYDPTRPEGVPWPPPDDPVLYRPTLPERFLGLAGPLGVTHTVVVEASDWKSDNDWLLGLAGRYPALIGIVGRLYPEEATFSEELKRYAAHPRFRGIRLRRGALRAVEEDGFLTRLGLLARWGLALDLLVGPEEAEFAQLDRLAEALPELHFVVDHIGHLRVDGGSPDPGWLRGMDRLGARRNVWCKVSGLVEATGRRPAPDDPEFYRPAWEALWERFGPDRLFYGSNWPVCERFADYETVFRIASALVEPHGPEAVRAFYETNATRCYGLRWE